MARIRDLSIKKKLIAMQLLTVFIVLLFFGVFVILNLRQVYRRSIISKSTSMAELIGANTVSALNFLDNEAAEEILLSLATEESIVNAWIYDANGNLFAKYSKGGYGDFAFPRIERESHAFSGPYITLSEGIFQDGTIIGMVSLRLDTKEFRDLVNRNVIVAFFVLIAGMIIASLLSILIQGTISKPILHLVQTAKEVSQTANYSIRIKERRDDEIGVLYSEFNNMLNQINVREMERDKAHESLKESEEKYRTLTENVNIGIYRNTPGPRGKFIEANPTLVRMFGYEHREEILALNVSDLYQNPERKKEFSAEMLRGESVRNKELQLKKKDGTPLVGSVTAVAVTDEKGKVVYYDGIIEDITERKQAEEALRKAHGELEERVAERTKELAEANEQLKELDRLKSAFIASMSHELRTPLNAIIGFTGIMLQGQAGEVNAEQERQLNMVYDSAQHLLALINDILDLSKIAAGKVDIVKEEFDVAGLIDRVVKTVSPLANRKGLELAVALSPEVGPIYSDKRRMEQILLNLVNNAIKFTKRGSVRIQGTVVDKQLQLNVLDTGTGIKPEDMGNVFQEFQQIKTAGIPKHEGTGLGLPICKKLVTMLGGDVWAESEYGVGSTFSFTLPIEKCE